MTAQTEMKILAARGKALAEAEAAKNIEAAISFWTEDAIFQANGAPQVQGKQAIRNGMEEFFKTFKKLEVSGTHMEIAASGDLAYSTGINRVVIQEGEADVLKVSKFLAVWQKIDGLWFITAISVTDNSASPTPF